MFRLLFLCLIFAVGAEARPTALVAGGAGFLGSHLCERLLAQGKYVVCLDNLATGSKENIAHLERVRDFEFVEGDICSLEAPPYRYSEIYNLACPASPPKYQADPIHTLDTCYLGTKNLLELAAKCNAVFFQASTSEIYGDPQVHPQRESYVGHVNPIGPRACYDEGKRVAETLCFEYHRTRGVAIKVVRIFNTYGPRMATDDGRVVSNFILQALEKKPLTLYGDGSQTRSFCYVDDLISGFMAMMTTPRDFTGPVNLGNPAEVTIRTFAETILALTDSDSEIIELPTRTDDPYKRKPDIGLALEKLNWTPHVGLKQGLELTIHYFRSK